MLQTRFLQTTLIPISKNIKYFKPQESEEAIEARTIYILK